MSADDGFCNGHNAPCAGCKKQPAPDLLNQLHTLRSYAQTVKGTADAVHAWQISAIVATMAEEATIAIEKLTNAKG